MAPPLHLSINADDFISDNGSQTQPATAPKAVADSQTKEALAAKRHVAAESGQVSSSWRDEALTLYGSGVKTPPFDMHNNCASCGRTSY